MKKNNTMMSKMNKMMKSVTTSVKTSKIFKTFYNWFIKFAKIMHMKPKILSVILGLIAVILLSLGLGVSKKEGYTSMEEADAEKERIKQEMFDAIDSVIIDAIENAEFRTKLANYHDKKMSYLTQGDITINENDVNADGNIYKLRDELFNATDNTLPQYVDNTPGTEQTTDFLTQYTLIQTIDNPVTTADLEASRNIVETQIGLHSANGQSTLTAAFTAYDKNIDDVHAYINTTSPGGATTAAATDADTDPDADATAVPDAAAVTGDENVAPGEWQTKYENLMEEMEQKTADATWREKYLDELSKNMGSDMANAEKWKKLYLKEIKKIKDYTDYANSHNLQYHGANHGQAQAQAQSQSQTQQFNILTGSTNGASNGAGNGAGNGMTGNVPPGDEDLYMLKSRMVPPSSPAGGNATTNPSPNSGSGSGSGSCNYAPAPVPPCPPCERCPEPAFDCKRVPKYNSASSSKYLPLPVLADFSQFGM